MVHDLVAQGTFVFCIFFPDFIVPLSSTEQSCARLWCWRYQLEGSLTQISVWNFTFSGWPSESSFTHKREQIVVARHLQVGFFQSHCCIFSCFSRLIRTRMLLSLNMCFYFLRYVLLWHGTISILNLSAQINPCQSWKRLYANKWVFHAAAKWLQSLAAALKSQSS